MNPRGCYKAFRRYIPILIRVSLQQAQQTKIIEEDTGKRKWWQRKRG